MSGAIDTLKAKADDEKGWACHDGGRQFGVWCKRLPSGGYGWMTARASDRGRASSEAAARRIFKEHGIEP